jgi:hypothetical protein
MFHAARVGRRPVGTRKKLIHIMSLNTNRPINRATVVACVISATSNHLKLNEPETLRRSCPARKLSVDKLPSAAIAHHGRI